MPIDPKTSAPSKKPANNDEDRRRELAEFLKVRRARVPAPQNEHFPEKRRRTPGLRREEVSEMAGVSASWYTWLEQGRDIRPSEELLARLSKVLRLNPIEAKHLFVLAGKTPPETHESSNEEVPAALKQLVLEVLRVPAFILGERTDFLLWNRPFTEEIIDLERIPKERRNWLDMIFLEDSQYRRAADWEEKARRAVAEFRWSVGKEIGSPWVRELINRLRKESPEFAQYWKLGDVAERKQSTLLETQHDRLGKRTYLRSIYIPAEAENLRLVVLTPKGRK